MRPIMQLGVDRQFRECAQFCAHPVRRGSAQ